jgi:hypothetical protein
MSGLLAKKTPNVNQPLKPATNNAEQEPHAGLSAFLLRETNPLLMWPNALKKTNALDPRCLLLWLNLMLLRVV